MRGVRKTFAARKFTLKWCFIIIYLVANSTWEKRLFEPYGEGLWRTPLSDFLEHINIASKRVMVLCLFGAGSLERYLRPKCKLFLGVTEAVKMATYRKRNNIVMASAWVRPNTFFGLFHSVTWLSELSLRIHHRRNDRASLCSGAVVNCDVDSFPDKPNFYTATKFVARHIFSCRTRYTLNRFDV